MCEWLLSGEWCDVQILCSGHVFSAHRTVLASVSTFLREILLSSSTEESQTIIILPDFEIEAMSSVLYYIYHGEAHIKSKNFSKFYEILKCLQIYIDDFCVPKDYNPSLKLSNDCSEKNGNQEKTFVHIKKVSNEIPKPNSINSRNFDQGTYLQSWNVLCNETLRNLHLNNGDRQRSSFHVGPFVSTYHWNGNSNGGADSVLAISNESYRAPSVPMMNINGKHLSVYEALPESCGHIIDGETLSTHTPQHPCQNFQKCNKTSDLELLETDKSSEEKKLKNKYKNIANNLWMNLFDPLVIERSSLRHESIKSPHQPLSLDLRVKESLANVNTMSSPDHTRIENDEYDPTIRPREVAWVGEKQYPKPAILNKVLNSPWSPHMTCLTKPFRRKHKSLSLHQDRNVSCDVKNLSDNNNNIDTSVREIVEKSTETDVNILSVSSGTAASVIDRDDMKCRICDQVFLNNDLRDLHMKSHSSNARYTCVECEKSFSQLRNYKYHMSVHRGTREFAATCTICGKYFNDKGYLSSHMKIHRNRKEYKCSVCPKSFNQRVAYNMHVRIHTGVKPHVCEECGKAFSRKMLLKQHQRTHSGERPYACPHCDKRFADRSNMTLHLRLHTGVKPFSCSLCSKSFTKKHHLKSHLNFHTGAKPYSCPRCDLAFTQSSNMRTHYKKCTASKSSTDNLLSE